MANPVIHAPRGSVGFNQRFHEALNRLAVELHRESCGGLLGLILCGGYGRGEGAVICDSEGREYAWNDVDVIPVGAAGRTGAVAAAIHRLSADVTRFEEEFRADLDVGRVLTERSLRRMRPVLLWLETARGHFVFGGDQDLLQRNIRFDVNAQPHQGEALKLLLNRGTGLLLAILKAQSRASVVIDCSDPWFVARNSWKCALALGDALLMLVQRYETDLSRKESAFRDARVLLQSHLGGGEELLDCIAQHYAAAVEFKVGPGQFSPEATHEELREMAKLWQLVWRACHGARVRAVGGHRLEPEEHRGVRALLRNVVHNARRRRISATYPREQLFTVFPGLLQAAASGTHVDTEQTDRFLRLWIQYN